MTNQDYFNNKNVTVVGLGRSGFACAMLLNDIGSQVSVTDINTNSEVAIHARQLPACIKQELGKHTPEFIKGRDLIVTSPGVDGNSQPLVWARHYGIPVISEIECAWMLCPAQVIAITGTNGKTTTTTLVGRLLEAAGRKTHILGNIGVPFSAHLHGMQSQDFVALEVSSFQLETIKAFKPKISVILNITPDHLDRYSNLPEYLSAKSRIFMNQDKTDYLVLNYDDPLVRDLGQKTEAEVIYFNRQMHPNPNFAAVMAIASILGIGTDLCKDVFSQFRGLPHRLETITELQGREFINDSKATNPSSTLFALSYIDKTVVLIAGGRDKGLDYNVITDSICKKLRCLVIIGEAKDKITQAFQGKLPIRQASGLTEAVGFAFQESKPGDCILLSPMCSSFDMFRDYQHRGEVFKQAVRQLTADSSQLTADN